MISLIPNYSNILKILSMSKNNPNIQFLNNKDILSLIFKNNLSKISEKTNSNVSGALGEKLVEEYLIISNTEYKRQFSYKNLRPDFVTKNKIIEVKTTLFNNTKYENIIYAPFKYYNMSKILNKHVDIVLVGYDKDVFENIYENNYLFKNYIDNLYKSNIKYIFYKDLLKDI